LVAEEARRRGLAVVAVAIEGEADARLSGSGAEVHWVKLGEVSRALRVLKEAGVSEAILAGQVKHPKVFGLLRADPALLRVLARLSTRNTQSVLTAVAEVLAEEGITLLDSTSFLTPLVATAGILGQRKPSSQEREDILFGFRVAREMARLDIGQSVVVKSRAVVAVEAMEGTDQAIERAAALVGGGLVVAKAARPHQDMRFDVPVVGSRTIEVMAKCKATALAVEAGKTLLLDRGALLARADEAEITVCGLTDPPSLD
jgi:DUF1009 family protein